ncbi:CCA tRNA nucleotidyltransferase [uncultured Litoreibacter sp.]|uniref:CCA tRNA nucleotidyltransferase n=1 Tax=uncultured Litoreibacter sp. TaxID=1392394 RepID=UPI0026273111|nr:CCA tRNA nucleotidyltransferase [uncultured Litoreibacter sp.]
MTQVTGTWLTGAGTQALFDLFGTAGHQLFCVGGCVRNALLDQPVADIDMATDATPPTVTALCEDAGLRVIPTGMSHGTVTVISDDIPFEITTFRKDVATDGRHATVAYSATVEEDARRRDFTMNALYAGRDGSVLDPTGGLDDVARRNIRFIGDAGARIAEDYLRILRFFRFYAWYGDPGEGIDAEGLAACAEGADGLDGLSRERVGAEMCKLLSAPDPAPAVAAMGQSGILARVMPGADAGILAILVHLENGMTPDWSRRALALGGGDLKADWRLSNSDASDLAMARGDLASDASVAELAYRFGSGHARNVALVRAASLQRPVDPDLEDEIARGAAAEFPIKAADLMPAFQGADLGEKLRQLKQEWIASDFTSSRAALLDL